MRGLFMLLLAVGSVSARPVAAHGPALADCDSDEFATLLAPAKRVQIDARAYWLDAQFLQWPGQNASGVFKLYYSATAHLRADTGQHVEGADEHVALEVPDTLPASASTRFGFIGDGVELAVMDDDIDRIPALLTGQVLLVHEDGAGRVIDATYLQTPGALDRLYAQAGNDTALGVSVGGGRTDFRLWAPTARSVAACVYGDSRGNATRTPLLQRDAKTGVWSTGFDEELSAKYYTYLVDVFVPGVGLVRNRVTDPYSIGLTADSKRSYIADLDAPALKPQGWDAAPRPAPLAAQTDMTIYELHVRDFSIGDASVPEVHRGRYLAFTDAQSAGMRHLRALREAGLSDIHLLPVFDIATIPETGCVTPTVPKAGPDSNAQQAAVMAQAARDCFNWGYDPLHYNVPEGSYATDAVDAAARIREFRAMVMALHSAGLRVGMDVVYNHTTVSGQQERSVLDRIVPGYYQRRDAEGKVERSTCCDNTATEHLMMGKLMADSVALWAKHYRIDSFGLPPAADNGKEWDLLRPMLADAAAIRPTPDDIAWMRDAFRDLLRIRDSSTLFRLRTAADVQQRLHFRNTGTGQNPLVIAGHLDGEGYGGANFREVLYLLNVSPQAQALVLPEEAGKRYVLHPVLADGNAADGRVKQTRLDGRDGRFVIPARTAVVYVVE